IGLFQAGCPDLADNTHHFKRCALPPLHGAKHVFADWILIGPEILRGTLADHRLGPIAIGFVQNPPLLEWYRERLPVIRSHESEIGERRILSRLRGLVGILEVADPILSDQRQRRPRREPGPAYAE